MYLRDTEDLMSQKSACFCQYVVVSGVVSRYLLCHHSANSSEHPTLTGTEPFIDNSPSSENLINNIPSSQEVP